MRYLTELILLLLPWLTPCIEGPQYFRPSSYSTIVEPVNYFRNEEALVPLTYRRDLLTEESKRKEASSRYVSKKKPYTHFTSEEDDQSGERYTSGEYSSESNTAYNSNENDSREYTIGTQIRVQHPITVPKKYPSSHVKHPSKATSSSSTSYKTVFNDYVPLKEPSRPSFEPAHESHSVPNKQRGGHRYTQVYDSTGPFHAVSSSHPSASAYSTYEPEADDFRPVSKSKAAAFERYKNVASKKQIEQYLEDQQKILEEALKMQLLNDPKFQQYVNVKEKERLVKEQFDSDELVVPHPPPEFHQNFNENFNSNNERRRPKSADFKRPIKGKPLIQNKAKPRRFRSALVINV